VGPDGFKKSLRHDSFIPDVAVIDPELTLSCPPDLTAACGMDAFTQLLESYVSTKSTAMTDALAVSGLEKIRDNLIAACTRGTKQVEVRAGMAYASFISGMTLANAGLGIVHGFAASIGGLFEIPHGVVCGTLMAPANDVTIRCLKEEVGIKSDHIRKYANVGALLSGNDPENVKDCCNSLIETLHEWTEKLRLPLLSDYGIKVADIERIVERTGNKNNPFILGEKQIREILLMRL
jgi:alcohol dehydrogenase class IV